MGKHVRLNELIGLTDRANHVALKAQQMSSSINDISCGFNFGHENFLEWAIEGSSSTIDTALSSSLKTYDVFQNALLTYFSTRLSKAYGTRIANVSSISRNTLANRRMGFTFRVYFLKAISDRNLRTEIESNIQSVFYDVIRTYFITISKSAKLPTSVKVNAPANINIVSKKTTLINQIDAVQSMASQSAVSSMKKISVTKSGKESGLSDDIFLDLCVFTIIVMLVCR